MRIHQIHVEGFGHFYQRTFDPVPEQVTVYYGPNEAGKSTLLAFIRAILFGFPRQYNKHYPPVAGGTHGGRLTIHDSAGDRFTVERFAGTRGGLSVTTPEGPATNAEAILQRLTGNATADLFKNVFAFSLDELREIGSLEESSGVIYSAGQGAPGLTGLKRRLKSREQSIYLSRGNNQEVPQLLSVLKDLDGKLRDIAGHSVRFGDLTWRQSEIAEALEKAELNITRLNDRIAEIDRLTSGWDDWVALCACESRLREIPEYADFPDEAVARLDQMDESIGHARDDYESLEESLRQAEESARAEIPDEALLQDRTQVEALHRFRGSYDDSNRDLPKRQTELKVLKQELLIALNDLGQDWDEADMEAFDTSLAIRSQIDEWKKRFSQSDETNRQLQDRLVHERRSLRDRTEETREAEEALGEEPCRSDLDGITERQDAIRLARRNLETYEWNRQKADSFNEQVDDVIIQREALRGAPGRWGGVLVGSLTFLGLAFMAAGWIFGRDAWLIGVLAGLVILGISVYLWRRGSLASAPPASVSPTLQRRIETAVSDTEAARTTLMASAAALGLSELPNADMLDREQKQLETDQATLTRWMAAKDRILEAERKQKSQTKRVADTKQEMASATATAEELRAEWHTWHAEQGLKNALTPEAMATFLVQVIAVREKSNAVRNMEKRVGDIQRDIQSFYDRVEPLVLRHQLVTDGGSSPEPGALADGIFLRFEEAQSAFQERQQAVLRAEESKLSAERAHERLRNLEGKRNDLLFVGGAEDTETFRRKAQECAQRVELVRQRDEHRRNLERLSGPGDRYESLLRSFDGVDPHVLDQQSTELKNRLDEDRAQCDSLLKEKGGIESELAGLTGEEESSSLRIQKHALVEQLKDLAGEWSRLVVASYLLERTQRLFEQERQPKVIQHARRYFSSITEQRYPRIFAPIGEQTITVVDDTDVNKQPDELSRGTREQLYLALRFGLIRAFGEHAETLPVVVDEALVNFDPPRTRIAAEAFASLADNNQVLVFTCHPHICDVFLEVASAQVVDIGR
ncbi:MAG: AAA family ATPase [Gemmatimonadota bacterium]|nr:AAA family ATPase [Gemmatimonadota bacterium]